MLLGKASSSVHIMYKPYLHILPTYHSGQQSAIVLLLVKVYKQIQLVWYSTSNLQLNMKDLLQCNHDLTNSCCLGISFLLEKEILSIIIFYYIYRCLSVGCDLAPFSIDGQDTNFLFLCLCLSFSPTTPSHLPSSLNKINSNCGDVRSLVCTYVCSFDMLLNPGVNHF